MKHYYLYLVTLLFLSSTCFSQVCIDVNNSSVYSSVLSQNGKQIHIIDLELIHDGSTSVDFMTVANNGTIIGAFLGTLNASGITDVTIEVEFDPGITEASLSFVPTQSPNSCPGLNFLVPLPKVDKSLKF